MKLIAEKLGKGDRSDRLRFVRADGSEAHCPMPRQGTLPHDLVHYVVESALPLKHGFLSLVAAGADPGFVMQALHDQAGGDIAAESVQAEAVVEALQTQLWAGSFDPASFLQGARLAASSRGQPAFDFHDIDPEILYRRAQDLLEQWSEVSFYASMELAFLADNRQGAGGQGG